VLAVQRALLNQLMGDTVAARIVDNQTASGAGAQRRVPAVGAVRPARSRHLERAGERGDIAPARRELQREHLNRIAALLLRPGAASRVDTRSLVRVQAQGLLTRIINAALSADSLGADTRAHLQDSADTLARRSRPPGARRGSRRLPGIDGFAALPRIPSFVASAAAARGRGRDAGYARRHDCPTIDLPVRA
jgi:hypothetical protein